MKEPIYESITLRDYFATKAMQGIVASRQNAEGIPSIWTPKRISALAYEVAEAMLEERKALYEHTRED